MTTLILSAYDPAARGSHKHRMAVLDLLSELQAARENDDLPALVRATQKLTELITPRLRTDDGTPVADALEQVSAAEFDRLTGNLLSSTTADTVPLASTPTLTE